MKLIIYLITTLITLMVSVYLIKRYKLSKQQVMIYCLMVLYWCAIIIVRAYRKSYAVNPVEVGGLALGAAAGATIASAYGFISIFARFLNFYISDRVHSKKIVMAVTILLIALTSGWVAFDPSYFSLLSNSLTLGLGASLLSLFNVLFASTFDKTQAMVSVSILSVGPLLAEFMMSPFQYVYAKKGEENYPLLWIISCGISVLALVFLFFVKDTTSTKRTMTKSHMIKILTLKETWVYAIVGIFISFIKFSTSGSNLITYFQSESVQMGSFLVAYSDFMFSFAQLFSGILAGLWFQKKIGLKNTLLLGIVLGIIFNGFLLTTTNHYLLFFMSAVSGFGYGLTYNTLIGLALKTADIELRDMSMAVFQTFFAIGVFYGDYIYKIILRFMPETSHYQGVFSLVFIMSIGLAALLLVTLRKESQ